MNEWVRHNHQPHANRNLQTQMGSKSPPRPHKPAPRSQVLPQASPIAASQIASPKILLGPAWLLSPKRSPGQAHLFPPSTHPHTAPAKLSERSGLWRPNRSLFKKPG